MVVLGGTSGERAVSLASGRACIKALKSKRFLSGVGLNMAGYDEKSDNNNKTNNKTNNNNSKFSDIRGGNGKVDGYGKPKKYLTDLDLYKK